MTKIDVEEIFFQLFDLFLYKPLLTLTNLVIPTCEKQRKQDTC